MNYSEEDFDWVNHVFKYDAISKFRMEEEFGFKFIEPQRDLEPGSSKLTKTTEAMERSRRMIIIISRWMLLSKKECLIRTVKFALYKISMKWPRCSKSTYELKPLCSLFCFTELLLSLSGASMFSRWHMHNSW